MKTRKKGISLVEMMIAVLVLGVGIVVVAKMFGQGGYIVGKSKWELYAMSIANGEVERINFFGGHWDNIKGYDWKSIDPTETGDFMAHGKIPEELTPDRAGYQKKVEIKPINKFLKEVVVSVQWEENTSSGRKKFQLNVPTLISNPKPFREYE